jgi:hypothetical protein
MMLEAETGLGGAPYWGGASPGLFRVSWLPSHASLAHGPSFDKNMIMYFPFDF